jgi:hypothetical protein
MKKRRLKMKGRWLMKRRFFYPQITPILADYRDYFLDFSFQSMGKRIKRILKKSQKSA